MSTQSEIEKRKRLAVMILGPMALGLGLYQVYGLLDTGPTAAPPAAPVIVTAGAPKSGGPAATKVGTSSAQLDPTLHMEPMLVAEQLVYTGSGRNIFAPGNEAPSPAPVKVEVAKNPARPEPPKVIPCPPNCPTPQVAQVPPINLKFFGTDTAQNGSKRAFLLNGDDVFVASVGDVVQRRYRVVSIAANSILVEDIPNTNKQTLPLVGN